MNDSIAPGAREFQTTRWSLALAAQHAGDATRAHKAMSELCRDYWYPLYAFVRRRGHATHDAQDLTQAFFTDLLERNPTVADPSRGKFRSYLLGALKHFLANEPVEQNDADMLYDKRWAMELLDRAMKRLRGEFRTKKEESTFDALKSTLGGAEVPREELAKKLGMSQGALKVAVHRLRQRYREVLRTEIAETVDSSADVDEEMRHLVNVLRR
jgi:hypothetical protein